MWQGTESYIRHCFLNYVFKWMKCSSRAPYVQHERSNPSAHRRGRGHSRTPYKITNLLTWPESNRKRNRFSSIYIWHAIKTFTGIFAESNLFHAHSLKFLISLLKLRDIFEKSAGLVQYHYPCSQSCLILESVRDATAQREISESGRVIFSLPLKMKNQCAVQFGSFIWLLLHPCFVHLTEVEHFSLQKP